MTDEPCPVTDTGACAKVLQGGEPCSPESCVHVGGTEWRVTYLNRLGDRTIWELCGFDEAVADRELDKAIAAGRSDRVRKESRPAGGVWAPPWEEPIATLPPHQ